jgi:hypothetical protein
VQSKIKAWNLLLKKARGGRVSSRYLDRTLKKAQLPSAEKVMGAAYIEEKLKEAYQTYYTTKGQAHLLRRNYLHTLAEAWAERGQANKERIYKWLLHVEQQRATATRIKFIREKLRSGSTTSVQVRDSTGHWQEISDKVAMEEAIRAGTKTKYTAAFGTPLSD